jgi:hypothetical protein
MADTPPLLLVVHTDVDPAHEDEFNTWYNDDHVPALIGQPGFIRARRYVAVEGQPKYLAIYEFEREENRKTPEYQKVRGTGPVTPHVRNMSIAVFRQIFEYAKPGAPKTVRVASGTKRPAPAAKRAAPAAKRAATKKRGSAKSVTARKKNVRRP